MTFFHEGGPKNSKSLSRTRTKLNGFSGWQWHCTKTYNSTPNQEQPKPLVAMHLDHTYGSGTLHALHGSEFRFFLPERTRSFLRGSRKSKTCNGRS